jgi:Zn-dependent peptidase ImmA (M78 family)/DNA-binding XRE family transcriptional regulator
MNNSIGNRIERARKAKGWSLRRLGEAIDKSHTAVRKYENGDLTPDSTTLQSLSEALGVRVEYFLRTARVDVQVEGFRSHFDMPEGEKARIIAEIEEKAERFLELLDLFPDAPIPEFQAPAELPSSVESLDELEGFAESVRNQLELGMNAIPNLLDELEEQGILVFLLNYEGDHDLDGLSAQVDGYPVIGLGTGWPGDRQRFTAAHEFAHFLLEGRLEDNIDKEDACNRFAGAFLAPRSEVLKYLGDSRDDLQPAELYRLKLKFGLSMAGWLHRAEDVGVITSGTYRRIRETFRDNGWLEDEPGEDLPKEQPTLFREFIFRAFSQDVLGEAKAAELLGISSTEFHRMRTMTQD